MVYALRVVVIAAPSRIGSAPALAPVDGFVLQMVGQITVNET